MKKHTKSNSTEHRQYIFLGGIAIIVGLLMWQASIEKLALNRLSGWASILLLECVGINFLALGVYILLVRLGMKVGLFTDEINSMINRTTKFLFPTFGLLLLLTKNPLLRNRIVKLFFGLVAISAALVLGVLCLSFQLKHLRLDQYVNQDNITTVILGEMSIFPFLAFVALLVAMLFQPLVNWIRSSSRTRLFVFVTTSILTLLPLCFMFEFQRSTPIWELGNPYNWFTSLRGPRIPPPNDLVVIDVRTNNPLDLIKTMAANKPKKMVIVPKPGFLSDDTLAALDKLSGSEKNIVITSYELRNVKTKYANLQFVQMEHMPYAPFDRMLANDSLTISFFLARERNTLKDTHLDQIFGDENGLLMYEQYSKWSFVTNINGQDEANGWRININPFPSHKESKFFLSKSHGAVTYLHEPNQIGALDSLKGKTLIFDFWELPAPLLFLNESQAGTHGEIIAKILMNIEQNDFIYRVSYIGITILGLFILLVNILCYSRLKPWPAIGTAIVLNALFFAGTLLIYAEWSILIYITPILYSIGIFSLIVFPYELVRERSQQLEERTRLATELKTARDMQFGLMPLENPNVSGYDIAGLCLPASEVGGDFYDYVWLDEEKSRLGIAVADVSGKAMKAAMTAVMTSGLVYSEIGSGESPKAILRKINRPMYLKTDRRVFTALSFAVIDTKIKELIFSNAGQMTPLLRRGDILQSINVEGPRLPLGVQEVVGYNEVTIQLHSGDILVLFTDGMVEAKNSKEELWGFERMGQAVKSLSQTMTAKEMGEALVAEANRFAGNAKQYDDMTIVVVRVL